MVRRKNSITLEDIFGIIIIVVIALTIVSYVGIKCTGGFNKDYSQGSRTGVLQKFSTKGVIFKSGEGILLMDGLRTGENNTIVNNTWEFSCTNSDLSTKIESLVGQKVKITYTQYFISPIEQSTTYNAVAIEELK